MQYSHSRVGVVFGAAFNAVVCIFLIGIFLQVFLDYEFWKSSDSTEQTVYNWFWLALLILSVVSLTLLCIGLMTRNVATFFVWLIIAAVAIGLSFAQGVLCYGQFAKYTTRPWELPSYGFITFAIYIWILVFDHFLQLIKSRSYSPAANYDSSSSSVSNDTGFDAVFPKPVRSGVFHSIVFNSVLCFVLLVMVVCRILDIEDVDSGINKISDKEFDWLKKTFYFYTTDFVLCLLSFILLIVGLVRSNSIVFLIWLFLTPLVIIYSVAECTILIIYKPISHRPRPIREPEWLALWYTFDLFIFYIWGVIFKYYLKLQNSGPTNV